MNENILGEFLITKFCHDIAGNVGAVLNGCELLAESSDDAEFVKEAVDTLILSAKNIADRVRFFRMAFGRNSNDFSLPKAVEITENYIATLNDITLSWEPEIGADFMLARAQMILAQIASGCLPKGGRIEIFKNAVKAMADRTSLNERTKSLLLNQMPEDFSSADVPVLFLMNYLKEMGYKIAYEEKDEEITFKVLAL